MASAKGLLLATGKAIGRARAAEGLSFGSALAMAISWSLYHSLVWACVHGFFSWGYVIYFALTRDE